MPREGPTCFIKNENGAPAEAEHPVTAQTEKRPTYAYARTSDKSSPTGKHRSLHFRNAETIGMSYLNLSNSQGRVKSPKTPGFTS
jgi:hypothetical protein